MRKSKCAKTTEIELFGKFGIGYQMIIDKEDKDMLTSMGKWYRSKSGHVYRDYNKIRKNGTRGTERLYLARFLLKPTNGLCVDHIDRNPLNNSKSNLRLCKKGQNVLNRNKWGKCRYRGAYQRDNKWGAYITDKGKTLYLGLFKTEIEAAIAYDKKAKELRKDFAALNF